MVLGQRVLDLGAGSGLVGIAAARLGAVQVLASETDPVAAEVLQMNAALNGVTLTLVGDLLDGSVPEVDLILVGDLFYDPALARRVMGFLLRVACPVLVGDIGRADLPLDRFRIIATYPVSEVGGGALLPGHVLALQAKPQVPG